MANMRKILGFSAKALERSASWNLQDFSRGGYRSATEGCLSLDFQALGLYFRSLGFINARPLHFGIPSAKVFKDDKLFVDKLPDRKVKASSKKPFTERRMRSFKQRTESYMLPFCLDIFISKKYIQASIMHRVSSRVVAVVCTNSKDLKETLKSRVDITACRVVGEILAERAKEADVFTSIYTPRQNEKLEGKLLAVVDSLKDHGITLII